MIEFTDEMNELQAKFEPYCILGKRMTFKEDTPKEILDIYEKWCKLVSDAMGDAQ